MDGRILEILLQGGIAAASGIGGVTLSLLLTQRAAAKIEARRTDREEKAEQRRIDHAEKADQSKIDREERLLHDKAQRAALEERLGQQKKALEEYSMLITKWSGSQPNTELRRGPSSAEEHELHTDTVLLHLKLMHAFGSEDFALQAMTTVQFSAAARDSPDLGVWCQTGFPAREPAL